MDERELIKSKIDIVQLVSEALPLKKAGRHFKANCPFHNEKTPSFIVSPELQIFKCFGCGKAGDIFGWLMEYERMDFIEALKILAKRAGVELVGQSHKTGGEKQTLKNLILEINHLAGEYFHYLLTTHKVGEKARHYLKERKISDESVKLFSLGYALNNWQGLIQFLNGKKGYSLKDLESAGLVAVGSSGRYYDRFRGRLMFPLKDSRRNVLGFAGRLLDPDAKEAKYVNTPETAVYRKGELLYGLDVTKEQIRKADCAVVVEGEIDAIQSYQAGVRNVIAIKGSALTEAQVRLIKRFSADIYLALDADFAGDAAARRGIETAEKAGLNIKIVKILKGKDPDECVRENLKLWQKSVENAVSYYDFLIDSAISRHGKETALGKKKISGELLPVLAAIENLVVRAHYLKRLARELDVNEEILERERAKLSVPGKTIPTEDLLKTAPKTRQEILEEYLLSLFLRGAKQEEKGRIKDEYLLNTGASRALKLYFDYQTQEPAGFVLNDFVKSLPAELVEIVQNAFLTGFDREVDGNKLNMELEKTLGELKKNFYGRKLKEQAEKIKNLSEEKEIAKAGRELERIRRILVALSPS